MNGYGFTQKDVWHDAAKYILPALGSKIFRLKTPWSDIQRIYDLIVMYCSMTAPNHEEFRKDMSGLDRLWPEAMMKLRHNRGMAKLMLDHGWMSRIILPYILQGAQAISLDVFYGKAFDLQDNFVELPPGDMAQYYAVWEAIGVMIRERIMFAQDYLREPGLNLAFCGAGLMPELRVFEDILGKYHPKVLACDADVRVLDGLKLVFDKPMEELGIDYRIANIGEIASDQNNWLKFDRTLAQGIPSYYHKKQQTLELLSDLARITAPGGVIIFDRQLMEWTLVRCATGMGWESDLTPDWTVNQAVRTVKWACDQLGLELKWQVDSRNRHPVGVMFAATKPLG